MFVEKEVRRLETDQTVVILRVEGLIKLGESSEFFVFAVKSLWGQELIVDLAKVDYIDSTGVGELIGSCVAIARAGQKLVLMNVTERITKLLQIAHAIADLRVLTIDEAAQYAAPLEKTQHLGGRESDDSGSAPDRGSAILITVRDARVMVDSAAGTKQMRVLTIYGTVQGVGYRFFAWRLARRIGLKGWIQNMPDGTVLAWVEGEQAIIEDWLHELRVGPRISHVTRIEQQLMDFTGKLRDFDVRF